VSSGVYQIRNLVNGNRYVGNAVNLSGRWRHHLSDLRHQRHHNPHLQAAFNKYGEKALVFEILERIEVSTLIEREQHCLDMLQPEYNISPTAGSQLGYRHTDEARERNRKASTGKVFGEKRCRNISESLKGHPISAETRRKISQAHMGMIYSAETRHKVSVAQRGRKKPGVSAALKGKTYEEIHGPERGAALRKLRGDAQRGQKRHPLSAETRRKLSQSLKRYHAAKRAMST